MPFHKMPPLERQERATLTYSASGEIGRGAFQAIAVEFTLAVAVYHYAVKDANLLWVISSAPFWGLLAAIFATSLNARRRKKSIVLALEVASRLLTLTAAFFTTGPAFAVAMALGIALNATGVPLITGIYGANFRTRVRGQTVGRLQAIAVGATALFAFLTGAIIDHHGIAYYRAILAVISLISLACSLYAYHLPEPHRPRNKTPHLSILTDIFKVLRTDHTFVYVEIIWFLIGFLNLWLIPIRVLHLEALGYDPKEVMITITAIVSITQVLTVGYWGKIVYRMNLAWFRILIGFIFIIGIFIFFYSENLWMLRLGTFFWGLGLAGGALSWRLVATFFTTPDKVPLYMTIHAALCGLRGIIASLISLHLLELYGVHTLANISISGLLLTNLMLLPLIPIMKKRMKAQG